jgi:hypothetical protein
VGRSWGHTLTPFTAEETARRDDWAVRWYQEHPGNTAPDHDAEGRLLCAVSGKCRNLAAWWGTYHYVTGRAGRVSTATRAMCDSHAARWRREHGAVDREPTGRPQTASQAIIGQLLDGEGS